MRYAARHYCGTVVDVTYTREQFSLVECGIVSQIRPLFSKEWSPRLTPLPFICEGAIGYFAFK